MSSSNSINLSIFKWLTQYVWTFCRRCVQNHPRILYLLTGLVIKMDKLLHYKCTSLILLCGGLHSADMKISMSAQSVFGFSRYVGWHFRVWREQSILAAFALFAAKTTRMSDWSVARQLVWQMLKGRGHGAALFISKSKAQTVMQRRLTWMTSRSPQGHGEGPEVGTKTRTVQVYIRGLVFVFCWFD